jgi:hypothetical protein
VQPGVPAKTGVAEVGYDPDVTSEYAFGDYLVRVDGGVIEQFARTIATSYRVPVAWASAEFEQRKHDVVRVRIGVAGDPAAGFFSGVAYANSMFSIEIPGSEEPRLRDFLSGVARDAGRVPGGPLS